jgi:catalase (peroxidase I)
MSITNFENYTHELTDQELEILPIIIHGFRAYKKNNPIKAQLIVTRMNEFLTDRGYKIRLTGPRLRKLVNYIRSNSLIPLIATSQGYFTTDCKETIENQIKSLYERANSIERCANGLKEFL